LAVIPAKAEIQLLYYWSMRVSARPVDVLICTCGSRTAGGLLSFGEAKESTSTAVREPQLQINNNSTTAPAARSTLSKPGFRLPPE
jgi:hypothetical protein